MGLYTNQDALRPFSCIPKDKCQQSFYLFCFIIFRIIHHASDKRYEKTRNKVVLYKITYLRIRVYVYLFWALKCLIYKECNNCKAKRPFSNRDIYFVEYLLYLLILSYKVFSHFQKFCLVVIFHPSVFCFEILDSIFCHCMFLCMLCYLFTNCRKIPGISNHRLHDSLEFMYNPHQFIKFIIRHGICVIFIHIKYTKILY